jgi:hypothetical protein
MKWSQVGEGPIERDLMKGQFSRSVSRIRLGMLVVPTMLVGFPEVNGQYLFRPAYPISQQLARDEESVAQPSGVQGARVANGNTGDRLFAELEARLALAEATGDREEAERAAQLILEENRGHTGALRVRDRALSETKRRARSAVENGQRAAIESLWHDYARNWPSDPRTNALREESIVRAATLARIECEERASIALQLQEGVTVRLLWSRHRLAWPEDAEALWLEARDRERLRSMGGRTAPHGGAS